MSLLCAKNPFRRHSTLVGEMLGKGYLYHP